MLRNSMCTYSSFTQWQYICPTVHCDTHKVGHVTHRCCSLKCGNAYASYSYLGGTHLADPGTEEFRVWNSEFLHSTGEDLTTINSFLKTSKKPHRQPKQQTRNILNERGNLSYCIKIQWKRLWLKETITLIFSVFGISFRIPIQVLCTAVYILKPTLRCRRKQLYVIFYTLCYCKNHWPSFDRASRWCQNRRRKSVSFMNYTDASLVR